MKSIKKKLTAMLLAAVAFVLCITGFVGNLNTVTAFAEEQSGHLDDELHLQTRASSYYSDEPAITVLTPGLGCSASVWSNEPNGDDSLHYNSSSLIAAICRKNNNNINLFYALCTSKEDYKAFDLYHLDLYNFDLTNKKTDHIGDASKHIVLLFESSDPFAANQIVYEQFEYVVDTISMQYRQLTGVLPRLNLVGHSRGGLTNIQYATEHPYNVDSIFSLGTPYNGSTFGQIGPILEALKYADYIQDEDGNGYYKFKEDKLGARDILDRQTAIELRDNWNRANTVDARIYTVAYASITSLDLVRAMLQDIIDKKDQSAYEEYYTLISGYLDNIYNVLSYAECFPDLAVATLNLINGFGEVSSLFGKNIYNDFAKLVNDEFNGFISYNAAKDVVGLFQKQDGKVVILDDLFIDANSQLGFGFDDGVEYNGFHRYVKLFTEDDMSDNRAQNQPAVVHNLETMNAKFVSEISGTLHYGKSSVNPIALQEESSGVIKANATNALAFSSEASGMRAFSANGATIYLYENKNGILTYCASAENELSYHYATNKEYVLVLMSDRKNDISYRFSIESCLCVGDNSRINLDVGKNIFALEVEKTGYYIINVTSSNAEITQGATKVSAYTYYVFATAGKRSVVIFENAGNSNVSANVSVSSPYEASEYDDIMLDSAKAVMKFTNKFNYSLQFYLALSWENGSAFSSVRDESNNSIASVLSENKKMTYFFHLGAGESCFVISSWTGDDVKARFAFNDAQTKWKIDGVLCEGDRVVLEKGKDYQLSLFLYQNGEELQEIDAVPFCGTHENWLKLKGNILSIDENAPVGEYIDIERFNDSLSRIIFRIGLGKNDISMEVENSTRIVFKWRLNADFVCDTVVFSVREHDFSFNNATFGQCDITDFIPRVKGDLSWKEV